MTLMEEDKQYIANTYGRLPFEAASGKNATCMGGDGKTYIDFSSGIGVNSLGFCDEGWAAAVAKQAATCLLYTSMLAIRLSFIGCSHPIHDF